MWSKRRKRFRTWNERRLAEELCKALDHAILYGVNDD